MSNEQKTPWYSLPYSRDYATVYTSNGEALIATMKAEHAAHIVRCVNSHDALVRALQHLADLHESNMAEIGLAPIDSITLSNARAALAAARGKV